MAGFETRALIPGRNQADLTYYKSRPKERLIPPMGNFQMQWINACKGNLKTSCDFDYGGKMIEMMLLGLVAYRVGKKVSYDGAESRTARGQRLAAPHNVLAGRSTGRAAGRVERVERDRSVGAGRMRGLDRKRQASSDGHLKRRDAKSERRNLA